MQVELSDGMIEILTIREVLDTGGSGEESKAWTRMIKEQMRYGYIISTIKKRFR